MININPYEEELRRLTFVKAMLRRLIDTTRDMKKKEQYRKKHEDISQKLDKHLKLIKIEMN